MLSEAVIIFLAESAVKLVIGIVSYMKAGTQEEKDQIMRDLALSNLKLSAELEDLGGQAIARLKAKERGEDPYTEGGPAA